MKHAINSLPAKSGARYSVARHQHSAEKGGVQHPSCTRHTPPTGKGKGQKRSRRLVGGREYYRPHKKYFISSLSAGFSGVSEAEVESGEMNAFSWKRTVQSGPEDASNGGAKGVSSTIQTRVVEISAGQFALASCVPRHRHLAWQPKLG